ncbi:hypothetical protein Ga0061079_104116 [Apibacter mensalis]|uniref:Uncharacterized protein n=1 Tax=Apibacter mensalis TaxID=1586267 RepID=A0A0X3APC0_9FLAO|nr:hypothetical protein Ga0061079_104116 [Apibacter mensalis]
MERERRKFILYLLKLKHKEDKFKLLLDIGKSVEDYTTLNINKNLTQVKR